MIADKLLDRLDKVKKKGENSWVAYCPAHNDKSPSLAITEKEDKVLIKCWSGCTAIEICASVGLDIGDLFPPKSADSKPFKKRDRFSAEAILESLVAEVIVLDVYNQAFMTKDYNILEFARPRYIQAIERIKTVSQYIEKIRL